MLSEIERYSPERWRCKTMNKQQARIGIKSPEKIFFQTARIFCPTTKNRLLGIRASTMKSRAYPQEYKDFRGTIALQKATFGKVSQKTWKYYDAGPKDVPALICIPGVAGTAECFFRQLIGLSQKGYRVIAVQAPSYMTHAAYLRGLDLLLEHLKIFQKYEYCHLLGDGLGGYMAQCYTQYRSAKIKSLILCNSFCDQQFFADNSPWSGLTNDDIAIPERLRLEVHKFYPGSRAATLKDGGNFPFLSRAEEFNMYLQVHLKANGTMPSESVSSQLVIPVSEAATTLESSGLADSHVASSSSQQITTAPITTQTE